MLEMCAFFPKKRDFSDCVWVGGWGMCLSCIFQLTSVHLDSSPSADMSCIAILY